MVLHSGIILRDLGALNFPRVKILGTSPEAFSQTNAHFFLSPL